jgi:hypothetical protein
MNFPVFEVNCKLITLEIKLSNHNYVLLCSYKLILNVKY